MLLIFGILIGIGICFIVFIWWLSLLMSGWR